MACTFEQDNDGKQILKSAKASFQKKTQKILILNPIENVWCDSKKMFVAYKPKNSILCFVEFVEITFKYYKCYIV